MRPLDPPMGVSPRPVSSPYEYAGEVISEALGWALSDSYSPADCTEPWMIALLNFFRALCCAYCFVALLFLITMLNTFLVYYEGKNVIFITLPELVIVR